ncbi:MAG TPA: hypothetical protein VF721_02430 [Pyrinomonadaceae bacterium]|jgi:hypothetical protein
MKLQKIFFALLILFAFAHISFGQNSDDAQPTENWLWTEYKIFGDSRLYHRYDRYSKEDLAKFKEKLDLMKDAGFKDEWEGIYSHAYEETVGFSQFRWQKNAGFVNFYIYTCLPELRFVDYGKIVETPDYIQILSERADNSSAEPAASKYVKVKWGEHRFLVEESALSAFAEKAVGIYLRPEKTDDENYDKWIDHWYRGDFEKPFVGLPEFPDKYKKLQRQPVETRITSVSKRAIEKEKELGDRFYNAETAFYYVTIGAGKNKGLKKGLTLDVPEIEDSVYILQVNQTSAVGVLVRGLNDDKNEICFGDDSNEIVCPKIKSGLKVKTQIGSFFW